MGKRKKTLEEFSQEVYSLVGDEYIICEGEVYKNTSTKLALKHIKCSHVFEMSPAAFLRGQRCPKCSGKMKRTLAQFKQEVFDLVGNEYEVIGDYKNRKTPIEIMHNKCNHKWSPTPSDFLRGGRCTKCSGLMRRDTEQFKKEIYDLTDGEYVLCEGEEYKNSKTKVKLLHNKCNHKFLMPPSAFISGQRCPKCSGRMKKTTEQFIEEVHNLTEDTFTVEGEYINNSTPITMSHKECSYKWDVRPSDFLKTSKCPKCNKQMKKNVDIFISEIYELTGDEYKLCNKEQYKTRKDKVDIYHVKCGTKYIVTPSDFLNGSRCSKCACRKKKTTEIFKQEVFNLVGTEYSILGEYVNSDTHIEIIHNKCNHSYQVIPHVFLSGRRCPKCKTSKGEQAISKWLDKNRIHFIPQHRLEDCRNTLPLPFDFAIVENDAVKLLIEYDGEGHYKPFRYSKDEEKNLKKFEETQRNDQIKNDYCKQNNIPLLRIPYWDFNNIESILEKEIHNKVLN